MSQPKRFTKEFEIEADIVASILAAALRTAFGAKRAGDMFQQLGTFAGDPIQPRIKGFLRDRSPLSGSSRGSTSWCQ
jgi:hypothetical protein